MTYYIKEFSCRTVEGVIQKEILLNSLFYLGKICGQERLIE